MASPALNAFATHSSLVESRAAENYSKPYGKMLEALGLKGTQVSVEQTIAKLMKAAGFDRPFPVQLRGNTHALGQAILGPTGYLAVFATKADTLKESGTDFNCEVMKDLRTIAERMTATARPH